MEADVVDYPLSFADYPESIAEHRVSHSWKASEWTPRDALIAVLRELDGGASCDSLVVAWSEPAGDGGTTHYAQATPTLHQALGLLRLVEHKMCRDAPP